MTQDLSIRVKLPDGAEVEVSGDQAGIERTLDDLQSVVSKVYTAFQKTKASQSPLQNSDSRAESVVEYPTMERPSGVQDGILKVLATDWGKVQPRRWREVDTALKHNAVHFTAGSITGTLTLLVKAGKLRRVKLGESYAYILPLVTK